MLIAQNQQANLEKYWRYRERMKNRFMVVSENVEEEGVNVPFFTIDNQNSKIRSSDNNPKWNHYLTTLATELWLLKKNNEDYSETLKDLYYAMLAFERIDLYTESYFRDNGSTNSNDINGFHLRDDFTKNFWMNNEDKFSSFGIYDIKSGFEGQSLFNDDTIPMKCLSQDNIYHALLGLAMVSEYTDTENVSDIPVNFYNNYIPEYLENNDIKNGSMINFSLWAKDIIKRYILVIQNPDDEARFFPPTKWYIENPVTNELVSQGNGEDVDMSFFYCIGALAIGEKFLDEDLQKVAVWSENWKEELFCDLFHKHSFDIPAWIAVMPFVSPLFIFHMLDIDPNVNNTIPGFSFNDTKIRTLGAVSNKTCSNTSTPYETLIEHRNNYMFNSSEYGWGDRPLEHLPLSYIALHNCDNSSCTPGADEYSDESDYYTNLLNNAPQCYPNSDYGGSWSHDSRLLWPEGCGEHIGENKEYVGLDYMMLHNLYYVAMRKEDFSLIELFSNEDLPFFSQYYDIPVHAGIIIAYNELTEEVCSGNMEYNARNRIELKPGFRSGEGVKFSARVQSRPGFYEGRKFKKLNVNQCREKIADNKNTDNVLQNRISENDEEIYYSTTNHKSNDPFGADSISWKKAEVFLYPNPAKSHLNISLNNYNGENIECSVYDISGRLTFRQKRCSSNIKIDVNNFSPGIYIVEIKNKNKAFQKKFSKN